jgi:hypothetical protein
MLFFRSASVGRVIYVTIVIRRARLEPARDPTWEIDVHAGLPFSRCSVRSRGNRL